MLGLVGVDTHCKTMGTLYDLTGFMGTRPALKKSVRAAAKPARLTTQANLYVAVIDCP